MSGEGREDRPVRLFHFSEDPSIEVFAPHVPATNPGQQPAVWAIDEDHQAAYWFPRHCPRVTVWCEDVAGRRRFTVQFSTPAARLHAVETGWMKAMGTTTLYRYELPIPEDEPTCTQTRQVHFVDALGVRARMDLAREYRLGGVALWALGFEDDAVWTAIEPTIADPSATTTVPDDEQEPVDEQEPEDG